MNRFKQDEYGRLIYYDNLVGYVSGDTAIIDENFAQAELEDYLSQLHLTMKLESGVYDRLSEGGNPVTAVAQQYKSCRIWQLKNSTDIGMRFIAYDDLVAKFGEPDRANYAVVYDGQMNTNDLEEIYTRCNMDHPAGYQGHSLSISDVVELYDENGSEFHYCDRFGFKSIPFEDQSPVQTHEMHMKMEM